MQAFLLGFIIAGIAIVVVGFSLLIWTLCVAASKEPPKPGDES